MGAVFLDRTSQPDETALRDALGESVAAWNAARVEIEADHGPIEETWAWSGAKAGWSLRLSRKGRPIAYLTPLEGACRASLALPERVVATAREQVDAELRALIDSAPAYPEGRAIRLVLRTPDDVAVLAMLARIRMAAGAGTR